MDTESLKTESESKTTENLRLSPVIGTSQFSKRKVKLRKSHSFKDNNTETTTVFADIDVEKSTKSETSSTSTNNSFQEKNQYNEFSPTLSFWLKKYFKISYLGGEIVAAFSTTDSVTDCAFSLPPAQSLSLSLSLLFFFFVFLFWIGHDQF